MSTSAPEPMDVSKPASSAAKTMPAFDLIAVGNTKVDIFFSFYQDNEKWRVTPRTKELALKLGEKIAVDRTDYSMGGNANNVVVGLSRLGYSVALMAEVGDDAFADDVEKNLRAEGVSNQFLVRTPGSRTSLGVAINVDGDRTLLSQHVARSHPFTFEGAAARLIFLTSIGNAWEHVYQKTLDFALENKVPIAFTPGTIQLREQPEVFWQVIKHTHILCVNKEEGLRILEGAHNKVAKQKEPTIEGVMTELAGLGPKIVVVTDGKNGSHARAEDGRMFHQETIPAVAVERTGAGDAFMAGLLGAALTGKSLQEAMVWGTRNAAAVVSKVGAQAGLLDREQMESNIMDMRLIDLGYTEPLTILPFDHRIAFAKYLFEVDPAKMTDEQQDSIRDFKALIYEAVKKSVAFGVPKGSEAILVDEETGAEVLRQAHEDAVTTILSVEKAEQKEFAFEYGAQFHQHIDKFKPTFTKAFIWYNMADSEESRLRQQAKLKEISDYSHERGYKFLIEMMIKPTDDQLEAAGGTQEDFDKKLKPELTVKAINELQLAGVEPDVWKLEGMESSEDYKRVVKAIKVNGRDKVGLVILGRGADAKKVDTWLEIGAGMPGVIGFSVGRTVFWDSIADYYHKKISRAEAIEQIAKNFGHFYTIFNNKAASFNSAVLPGMGVVEGSSGVSEAHDDKGNAAKEDAEQGVALAEAEVVEDQGKAVDEVVNEEGAAAMVGGSEGGQAESGDGFALDEVEDKLVAATKEAELALAKEEGQARPEEAIDHGFAAYEADKPSEAAVAAHSSFVAGADDGPAFTVTDHTDIGNGSIDADDESDDEDMPRWAVNSKPLGATEEGADIHGAERSELNSQASAVVGGFSVEPSFEVPEEMTKEEPKKGLGRFFSRKK